MSELLVRAVLHAVAAGCSSALDVGSGTGKYPAPVARWETVDPYEVAPSTKHHQKGALAALRDLEAGSFDLVYALDFIEHLSKADGLDLLNNMERLASVAVLVFTPRGYVPNLSPLPGMAHLSGWEQDDFRARGYMTGVCDFDYGQGKGMEPNAGLWAIRYRLS